MIYIIDIFFIKIEYDLNDTTIKINKIIDIYHRIFIFLLKMILIFWDFKIYINFKKLKFLIIIIINNFIKIFFSYYIIIYS